MGGRRGDAEEEFGRRRSWRISWRGRERGGMAEEEAVEEDEKE